MEKLSKKIGVTMNNEVNWLTSDGYKFCYKVEGVKPTNGTPHVLFISGAFQNMHTWDHFKGPFLAHTRVITADLPGIGDADLVPAQCKVKPIIDAIDVLLDELNVKQVYIISASYGTPLAISYAAQNPNRVAKMVVAGTTTHFHPNAITQIKNSLQSVNDNDMDNFRNTVISALINHNPNVLINKKKLTARLLNHSLAVMDDYALEKYKENTLRLLDDLDFMDKIDFPHVESLVFTGEYDTFTPPNDCKKVYDKIHNGYFTTIKNADHLFHLEQMETTKQLITNFFLGEDLATIENVNQISHLTYEQ